MLESPEVIRLKHDIDGSVPRLYPNPELFDQEPLPGAYRGLSIR